MLEAIKENKVYRIDETMKTRYLNEGFDIYKDGVILEYSPKKVIKYSDHIKAMKELKKSYECTNVLEYLKKYAENKNIDVGSSNSARGILDKISEAEKE